jgi:hypothetical protein
MKLIGRHLAAQPSIDRILRHNSGHSIVIRRHPLFAAVVINVHERMAHGRATALPSYHRPFSEGRENRCPTESRVDPSTSNYGHQYALRGSMESCRSYLGYAAKCLDLAANTRDSGKRLRLVEMAEKWRELAEVASNGQRRRTLNAPANDAARKLKQ